MFEYVGRKKLGNNLENIEDSVEEELIFSKLKTLDISNCGYSAKGLLTLLR